MRLEALDSLDALERFQPEWSSFVQTIPGLTPFQMPDWLLTWWRHFGSGRLRVLVFREEAAIAAVIPLFEHNWEARRQLTLIGSGVSDYLEPPVAQKFAAPVIDLLRAHLRTNDTWDVCDWQDLSAETSLTGLGAAAGDTPCSEIALSGSFEDYWARRSKDLRRNLRRYGTRADEMGSAEFTVASKADAALIDELIRLHSERWRRQNLPGMVVANNSAAFLREIAARFASLGMLRFFCLRSRNEVVAVSIGFLFRNALYSYLSAFDPRFEILGFGRRLLFESLRFGFGQAYRAWNFCRGDEPYKFSFGAARIPKCRLILHRADLDIS